jgi:hypothetical protein
MTKFTTPETREKAQIMGFFLQSGLAQEHFRSRIGKS